MVYLGPKFYLFYYEPRDKFEEAELIPGHKIRVVPPGYKKPDRVLHNIEIMGLTEKENPKQVVHIHVTSSENIPENVNYFQNTDKENETTKIVVEFAKLVAKGIVDIRQGSV